MTTRGYIQEILKDITFFSEVLLTCSMRDRLLLVVLLTSLVVAVDRSKFKSCSQSGFCKRCRAVEAGGASYQV